MTIDIILDNGGGELDKATIEIADGDDFDDRADDAISNVLDGWTFRVGDTIRIEGRQE